MSNLWNGVELTEKVKDTAADNIPAEIEYSTPDGKVVGYWAYGRWEPDYPFQGEYDE